MEHKSLGKTDLSIPVLGMGTWGNGFRPGASFSKSVEALKKGLDLGMTLIDTSESYGSGFSEKVVGQAIKGRRESVFIATKVSTNNFSYDNVLKAANKSLARLETDVIDLYQIHFHDSSVPVKETIKAMEHLVNTGKIRSIGVSNFSVEQTREAQNALSKNELASNQMEYSILNRKIEFDVLPYCQQQKITLIAYTPLASGNILKARISERLNEIGNRIRKTPIQVALNWLLSKPGVITIPKAAQIDHIEENAGAVGWTLSNQDINLLNAGVC